jgi:ElaB/YqjD/DUF883 family membrane-anchored ribosome-binding protein
MQTNTTHADKAIAAAGAAVDHFKDGARSVAKSREEIIKEFENLIRAGDALLQSTTHLSGAAANEARELFSRTLKDAQGRYQELSKSARAKGVAAANATDQYVRENPWPAIGFASGIAFLAGILAARR